ncbi:hypothetical protein ACOSQ4_020785 [Xanthoceras sorbifolium]
MLIWRLVMLSPRTLSDFILRSARLIEKGALGLFKRSGLIKGVTTGFIILPITFILDSSSWRDVRSVEAQLDSLMLVQETYWKQRFRSTWLRSEEVHAWSASFTANFNAANLVPRFVGRCPQHVQVWSKPPVSSFKLNSDDAMSLSSN